MTIKKLLMLLFCLIVCLSACGNNEPSEIPFPESYASQEEIPAAKPEIPKVEEKPAQPKNDFTYKKYPVKIWVNSLGTPWAQAIFSITNTSDHNLYLSSSSLDLETESGALVATRNYIGAYPQIIAPGETGYYYEEFALDSVTEGELNSNWHLSVESATVKQVKFPVTDIVLSEDNFGFIKAIGRVENPTGETQSLVFISIMLFDAENNPIGHMFTFVELAPNDKKGFECSSFTLPDDISIDDVASYTAVAFKRQYQY